jgi:hypothetical protein
MIENTAVSVIGPSRSVLRPGMHRQVEVLRLEAPIPA